MAASIQAQRPRIRGVFFIQYALSPSDVGTTVKGIFSRRPCRSGGMADTHV